MDTPQITLEAVREFMGPNYLLRPQDRVFRVRAFRNGGCIGNLNGVVGRSPADAKRRASTYWNIWPDNYGWDITPLAIRE